MKFTSPTGSPIVGTLESITGRANATEYSETGDPDYEGETEVFWDDQKTVMRRGPDANVSWVYLDEAGAEWLFYQLVPDTENDETEDETPAT